MATHSSTLAWQIPWMEEPGRLQSLGLMSVFPIGLAGEETMVIKFACSQTFSRYSKKHSGFICVFFFFLLGQIFFSLCLFLVLCFLIHLKHYHQMNLPKIKFLFLSAS